MRSKPTFGFSDYLGDALYLIKCLAIAAAITYPAVMFFQPDAWRLL